MSNHLFNPFQVQKFFAQNIITSKLEPGGKYEIASNIIYVVAYYACFIAAIYFNDNKVGELRYNFISQMRFCMQFYFGSVLLGQIAFTTNFFRKQYVNSYHALINNTRELRKINVHTEFTPTPIVAMYLVVSVSATAMIIFDMYSFWHRYNIMFFICHYLPSLAISAYVISISSLMRICTSKFVSINAFLATFARPNDSNISKYQRNKRNEPPDVLLTLCPDGEYTIYQKLFIVHDEVAETARLINAMSGYDLLVFMIIVTVDVLSFVYDIFMDLVVYINGNKLPPRTIYATEYWSIMTIFGATALISASSGLMDNANNTKTYLHQLRNLYPQLNEQVELFSLQLIHSKLKITAGNFFTIHRGILYKLLSAWITYIVIFMQLDTDVSTAEDD